MIKDVDIVCLFTTGYYYPGPGEKVISPFTSEKVYDILYGALSNMSIYKERLRRQKRSIGIEMGVQLDVIPAIAGPSGIDSDPILIPEKKADGSMVWIDTYTRVDIKSCSEKNSRCNNNFVQVAKILKYWRNVRLKEKQAPCSYFLETLLHNVPDNLYFGSIAPVFVNVCRWIENNITPDFAESKGLTMIGSGDNLFSPGNWSIVDYSYFHDKLSLDTNKLAIGLHIKTSTDEIAAEVWQSVFGRKFPKEV